MPATSPGVCSSTSALKPLRSQYLAYMRSSICAQSCASVPPEPDWMSMKQLLGSSGSENMRRNSRSATVFPACATSVSIAASVASSFSERASWNSSRASRSWPSRPASTRTMFSSCFFSRPSSWARLGSDQMSGFSSSLATAARRACLPSKSKIPPQLLRPRIQAGERRGDLIDAFGFHDGFGRETRIIGEVSNKGVMPPCISPAYALLQRRRGKALVDLVLEEARRRGRRHELAVHFGRDAPVGEQPAVAEFDFENLGLGVVADRADLARIDAFAFHAASRVVCATTPAGLIFLSVGKKMSWIDFPIRLIRGSLRRCYE